MIGAIPPLGWMAAGLLLGLLSAAHCLGMCGPIAFYVGGGTDRNAAGIFERIRPFIWLSAGKALVYGWIGFVFGWSGTLLAEGGRFIGWARFLPTAGGLLIAATGLSMAGIFPRFHWRIRPLEEKAAMMIRSLNRRDALSLFSAGMLWGFLPCPMVLIPALGSALCGGVSGMEGAAKGFFMMLGFGAGTFPALAAGGVGGGYVMKGLRRYFKPVWAGLIVAGFGAVVTLICLRHLSTGTCHPA